MSIQIKLRRDTYANWTSVNHVLAEGEIGLVTNFADNNKRIKIGDGVTAWEDLDYFTTSQDLSNYVTDAELASALSNYVPTSRTVNGKALSSNISIDKTDVGLGSVDNTSDANKPISTATQTALDLKQDEAIVISSNTTAVNDAVYHNVATATYTDPSPVEGKGFTVFVRNGTATVGGTAYATGKKIIRTYHSGSWLNDVFTIDSVGAITPVNTPITNNITVNELANRTQGQLDELNDLVGRGYVSPKLYRWLLSFISSPSTAKIAFVGDSTSDLSGNASGIPNILTNLYVQSGDLLAGINVGSNVLDFGSNGNTIQNFNNSPAAAKGFNAVVAAAPNLIVFSYGINDVRQNQLTKDQLKAQIITAINNLRDALPNTDFVLRMPNSFLIPATDFYIKQGSYPSLAAAAQGQSDILYNAYRELADYWDNVTLFNSQELIFGRTSLSSSNQMSDEIHPFYKRIIEEIVKIVGYKSPFSKGLSLDAINKSYTTPWVHYPRVFENTDYFELVLTGRGTITPSTRIDIDCNAYEAGSLLHGGLAISIGDTFLGILPTTGVTYSVVSATVLRLTYTVPASSITTADVKIYRHKFNYNSNSEAYVNNSLNYPYRRCLYISSAGAGYIDLSLSNSARLNSYLKDPLIESAWLLRLLTSNTLIFNDGTVLSLAAATIGPLNNNAIRVLIAGTYTSYNTTLCFVFGSQQYELANSTFQGALIYPSFNVTATNGFGGLKNGFFKFLGTEGEASVAADIYKNVSPVGGDTISNTVTKTYFASFLSLATSVLSTGEWIDIEGWYLLSGAVAPGNITFYADLDGASTDALVLSTAAITIPSGASNHLLRLQAKIFIKIAGANGVISGQGILSYPESGGAELYVMKRTTDINPYSIAQAIGVKIGVKFSVADAANTITQTAIRIQTIKS